jgi:hypothetical protein
MYKKASQLKLRFATDRGILSTEQLWSLDQNELTIAIEIVNKVLKKDNDDNLSFLDNNKNVDEETQLRFDILKDVYLTKKKDLDDINQAYEDKIYNKPIISAMADLQEKELKGKSLEELGKNA